MGLLDRMKKAMDSGGVGVKIAVGKTFRWSDDVLPVDVTVSNSADEPRVVTSVRVQLVEYEGNDTATTRKVRGRYEGRNLFLTDPFTVGAGEEHALHIDMPLSLSGSVEMLGGEDKPEWVQGLSGVLNSVTELNRDSEWYLLRVIPEVEGFTAKKIGSQRIRNLRTGEWGGGMIRTRFNID